MINRLGKHSQELPVEKTGKQGESNKVSFDRNGSNFEPISLNSRRRESKRDSEEQIDEREW